MRELMVSYGGVLKLIPVLSPPNPAKLRLLVNYFIYLSE